MKKLSFILLIIVLAVAGTFIFIPNDININESEAVYASESEIHQMLFEKDSIATWWPGKLIPQNGVDFLVMEADTFHFADNKTALIYVKISDGSGVLNSNIYSDKKNDHLQVLHWVGTQRTSYNPIERIQTWRSTIKRQRNMKVVLAALGKYYSDQQKMRALNK